MTPKGTRTKPATANSVGNAKPTPATDPVPQEQRPRLLPPGAITALRVVGHDVEVALPVDKDTFTVGSKPGAVDVVLPLKQISRLQALGQRDGTWVTFRDQGSSNGQFLNGRPEATIHIAAGQVFRWANVDVIALDDYLRDLRDRLAWFLGFDAHSRVDAALALAAHDGPILLTARRTCQPTALARAIHRASGRRAEPFRVLDVSGGVRQADIRAVFAQASRGTVYLDLSTLDGPAPDHLAKWLVGVDYGVRAVVSTTAADQARKHLDHYAMRFSEIEVPTIATRRQDVPRLLDGLLQELGSSRRVAELGRDRVAALAAFAWPEDIDQLRRAAERIQAYLDHGCSVAAAAAALNVKPQSMHEALTRIGALGLRAR